MKSHCLVLLMFCSMVAMPCLAGSAGEKPPELAAAPLQGEGKILSPEAQAVLDAQKAAIEALKKGDAEFFRRTLTDDFTAIVTTGDMAGKDDFVEGVAGLHGKDLRFYDFKVLPLNENAAVVTYNAVLPGEGARYQHLSNVWVKQGDQWKLKFQQSTPNLWSLGDI